MKKILQLLSLCLILQSSISFGATYYWIGGSGSWSNTAKWSLTSGGTTAGAVPTATDHVVFNASSGLTNSSTVTLDVAVTVTNFDFSAVATTFAFSSSLTSIEIRGNLVANGLATFSWTGSINLNPTTNSTLTSNGQTWINDIHLIGTNAIQLVDNFSSSADVYVDQGTFNLNSKSATLKNFYSTTSNTRTLTLSNGNLTLTGTIWNVNATNGTLTHTNGKITATNASTLVFSGGGFSYDTLIVSSGNLSINNNNSFKKIKLTASTAALKFNNGSTQQIETLVTNGTCAAPTQFTTINSSGANATLQKTGSATLTAANLTVTNINANTSGGKIYHLSLSDTSNSTGWTFTGQKFYWIGGGGNWSSGTKWSFTSNGTACGCIPNVKDSVIFDSHSFSSANQVVKVDQDAYFSYMDWATASNNPTFRLLYDAYAYGDVTFKSGMKVIKDSLFQRIEFADAAHFNPDNASISCNVSIRTTDPTKSVFLDGTLSMADSTAIYISSGKFYTQNYTVNTGAIQVVDTTTALTKTLSLGSSAINLAAGFTSIDVASNFTFQAGTSTVTISSTNKKNFLLTNGLTFYNVTLKFPKIKTAQRVAGNNTYNKLKILKGSVVVFDSTTTHTIVDSLILIGDCKDSITLSSSKATLPFKFSKAAGAVSVECVKLSGNQGIGGATFTALFSTDKGNNSNWTFSTTKAAKAGFTANGPFCFGDTTRFTNTTVPYKGTKADYTSKWYFGDGSTGYFYKSSPTDSTWINYEIDTNQHKFKVGGSLTVQLITIYKNYCADTASQQIFISKPDFSVGISDADTTICAGDLLRFDLTSSSNTVTFEIFKNGISQNTPSVNDTLYQSKNFVNNDLIKMVAYENGCTSVNQPTFTVKVNALPNLAVTSSDLDLDICLNTPVTFTASGADVYRFFKNNTPLTSYLTNGSYSISSLANNDAITVVGKNQTTGCLDTSAAQVFTVRSLPSTSLSSSATLSTICDKEAITFTASGANSYQFFVDNSAKTSKSSTNTFVFDSLTSGQVVKVIGYSTYNCAFQAPETFSYTVNPLPHALLTSSDSDQSICTGDQVTFTAAGGSIYEFFKNGVSLGAAAATTSFTTNTLANQDKIYANVTFSGCSAHSDTLTFTVHAAPATQLVSSDADSTICELEQVNFTASGAQLYQFFINGTAQGIPSATPTFSTTTLSDGQTVSVIGTSNGCSVSAAIPFTVLNLPVVPIYSSDADNTICAGASITISSANCDTYQLFVSGVSQGAAQAAANFNPSLTVGTKPIYIKGTGANGCSLNSDTLSVTINPIPTVILSSSDADNTICNGDQVTFTGSGSTFYQFFLNGASQGPLSSGTTFTTSSLTNGQTVYVKGSSLGCIGTSATITTTVNQKPAVVLTCSDANNIFCTGDAVTYTAGGATNYQFYVNSVSQGAASTTNTLSATNFPIGSYTVQVVGSQNNCTASSSKNVTVNALPNATLLSSDVDNAICSGQNVTYTASGGSMYLFKKNGINSGSQGTAAQTSFSNLVNNDIISVQVTSSQGCQAEASMAAIQVTTTPTVTLSNSDTDNTICANDAITFTATGATQYEYFISGVSQGVSNTATLTKSNFQSNTAVYVIGSTNGCATTSSTQTITVHLYPVVTLSNAGGNSLCTGELTQLTALGANNYQFLKNGVPVGAYSTTNTFSSSVNNGDIISVNGETFGCIALAASTIQFTVNTYPTLVSNSSDADNIICKDDLITFTSSGATNYDYQLNNNSEQFTTTATFSINTLASGDVIKVIGYNGKCASTPKTFTFTVNEMPLALTSNPSNSVCSGTAVTFTATGGDQYQFFVNNVAQGSMSATANFSSSSLQNGDQITFKGKSTTTGCIQNYGDYILMNISTKPSITSLGSLTICSGDSVQLVSSLKTGNQWWLNNSAIAGAIDTSYSAKQSGVYSVTVQQGGAGQAWGVGLNATGILGDSTNQDASTPIPVQTTTTFQRIFAGSNYQFGISSTGAVYGWGTNTNGQLGIGNYTSKNYPYLNSALTGIQSIACAETSVMAVDQAGAIFVWGNNNQGQLGTGNLSTINFPYANTAITGVDTIAAGKNHFILLKKDGTVWSVGDNTYGQLGNGTLIAAKTFQKVGNLSNIVAIGTGEYHSFAISATDTIYAWGNNTNGQLGTNDLNGKMVPTAIALKQVKAVAGGAAHSLFLLNNGKIYATGDNTFGQLGIGNTTQKIKPTLVPIGGGKQIVASKNTSLTLRNDLSVFGCGSNTEHQLTASNTTNYNTFTHLTNWSGIDMIAASPYATHVIYANTSTCSSNPVNITVLPLPTVDFTVNGAVFTATTGATYQWYLNGISIPGATQQTYTALTKGKYTVNVTFANGCSGTSPVFSYGYAGLDQLNAIQLQVYPNPTQGEITIDAADLNGLSLSIKDNSGRLVYENELVSTNTISIHHLTTGSYFLIIQKDKTIIYRDNLVKE